MMSASRFVNQLVKEGFLEHGEHLQIVRAGELLDRWRSAHRKAPREVPVRWILKSDQQQLRASVLRYAAAVASLPEVLAKQRSRICLGLFSAADALGLGFVRGLAPHLYVDRLEVSTLKEFGLTLEDADRRADLFVRVPAFPESVFRGVVHPEGLPVSDVFQIWLDVSAHPTRGREQAEEIRRRVLKPLYEQHS
jgi:hypothetical protein